MRESNYKAVSSNKAAVTITTSLYDRRALDVTSDKPLVNSLNYLTYLVSSSAKVRETLSIDGGIERLVEILHECHNATFNLNDTIFNSEKKLLTAWKWTLAFQCLVLVGTRGTEKIRQKVVKAGILPIIATVLDNYLSLHERTFIHANSRQQLPSIVQNRASNHYQQFQQQQASQASQTAPPFVPSGGQAQNPLAASQQAQPHPNQAPQDDRDDRIDHSTHQHLHIHQHQQDPNPASSRQEQPLTADPSANLHPSVASQSMGNPLHRFDVPPRQDTPTQQIPQQPPTQISQMSHFTFQPAHAITPIPLETSAIEATSITNTHFPTYFNNNHANNLTNDDYENLTLDQLFKLIRFSTFNVQNNSASIESASNPHSSNNYNDYINQNVNAMNNSRNTSVMNDVRRRHMIIHIIKKLKEEKELEILDDRFLNDNDYEMDNNLQFLTNLYLQDFETNKAMINSKIAVRNFTETGVVIPRDDDIVWSLQLLAYISKYSYLKDVLQNTHLVIDMSIRDKQLKIYLEKQMKLSIKKSMAFKMKPRPKITPRSRKSKKHESSIECEDGASYHKHFNPSASNSPQISDDIYSIHDDSFLLDEDKFELYNRAKQTCLTENAEMEDDEEDDEVEEYTDDIRVELDKTSVNQDEPEEPCAHHMFQEVIQQEAQQVVKSDYVNHLYELIVNCESVMDDLERDIKLFQINDKMNKYIEVESRKLVQTIIQKRQEKKEFLTKKWNYDEYAGFDIDEKNEDQDDSLIEYKKVNLFPIVEKFTFLTGTDMYYWSGVIMRNSCRRNELRGSVRQCGNLECGKWERYPREFSKCRRCKRTKYCSRECQMKAWHCHRNWCVPSNSSNTTGTTNTSAQASQDSNVNADDSVNGGDESEA